ncbi:hypothetical protein BC936DRAFT_137374 [Jimgerdemannia flammicorona]|uniref:Secreted protein n=1 Tax=Jimgerdemannia flammicorona TaxID=994334 RepID=A0A433DJ27_9FUNG|nr:hypothetical protein BC936DRAFT_137374 [Jimgerdemannia flammicorona]
MWLALTCSLLSRPHGAMANYKLLVQHMEVGFIVLCFTMECYVRCDQRLSRCILTGPFLSDIGTCTT